MNGIDISNWQNGINLAAVPFDFVICKATEGTRYVSPDCDRQIQQAIGLGKLVGVYHYVNGGDAEAEAEYFYEHCKGYVGKAAFFIDWEDQGNKAWGDTSYLKAMAERLAELLGVSVDRIGIYASKSVFPWNLTDAKTWVAQYADMNATGYQDAPWNEGAYDCDIRQYSSCGRLDGWAGNLDINKCYTPARSGRPWWAAPTAIPTRLSTASTRRQRQTSRRKCSLASSETATTASTRWATATRRCSRS